MLISHFAKIVAGGEIYDIDAADARGTERLLGKLFIAAPLNRHRRVKVVSVEVGQEVVEALLGEEAESENVEADLEVVCGSPRIAVAWPRVPLRSFPASSFAYILYLINLQRGRILHTPHVKYSLLPVSGPSAKGPSSDR